MEEIPKAQERSFDGGLTWKYLPSSVDPVDFVLDFRTKLLSSVRPNWDPEKVRHVVFDEGITNKLVAFHEEGKKKEDVVLLRLNGSGTENMIDREAEIMTILALNRAGLSPPLYFQLENGLCYGFAQGVYLSVDEMADEAMMKRVARNMARFHSVPVPLALQSRKPQVWAKCEEWMKIAPRRFDDPDKNEM